VATRWKKPGTAIAAAAWVAVCIYLYFAWPSLAALLGTVVPPGGAPPVRGPRLAFPTLGLLAVFGLIAKDRCLRTQVALLVDAVVAAPALAAIAFLVHPIFVPAQ
jgi:hypothetical protein